ncbi:efflux RND transporter periplasmic adaptor subunit [Anatilimnocola floriformis]|uniref:efflux RND transporter periplasmic adaptor subunit n=1 Tax=Anatilimnocola floriformis TaxID=2948575 RepID=UPI0020C522C7|nr:efflux RND transporter periplasmic adaptor subunit [Anatilimnocola floriformis]
MATPVDLSQLAVDRSGSAAITTAKRRNLATRYGLPLGILVAFAAVIGWSLQDSLLPAKSVTITPVVLTRAEVQQSGTPVFQAAGWIEPRPTATVVSAQVEGVVESLLVVEGQEVQLGQPLAKLVEADARIAVAEAKAALRLRDAELELAKATCDAAHKSLANPVQLQAAVAEAEASLAKVATDSQSIPLLLKGANARLQLAGQELEGKLKVGDAIPQRSVQRAQSEFDNATATVHELEQRSKSLESEAKSWQDRVTALRSQLTLKSDENRRVKEAEAGCNIADARVEQAKLAVETAELRLTRMTITSPISGRVLALHAQPGRRLMGLSPASERDSSAVVSLYDPKNLQVRADVRLEDVPNAQLGQPVQISTAALATPLIGEVVAVTSQADIQKNTLQVKVLIHDPPAVIKPEMLVQVTFLAPERPGTKDIADQDPLRKLIPKELVKTTPDRTTVWVADLQTSRARQQAIQLGKASTDRLVEVVQGLTATDKLIVSGRDELSPGKRIRVIGEDQNLNGASNSPAANTPAPQVAAESKNQK